MNQESPRIAPSGKSLIFLPSLLGLSDIAATLLGQTAGYWSGNRVEARDANPAVRWALELTPFLAVPAAIGWIGMITILMTTLPPSWRQRCYLFLCIAHLIFVWGWIVRWNPILGGVFSLVAILVAFVMVRQIRNDNRTEGIQVRERVSCVTSAQRYGEKHQEEIFSERGGHRGSGSPAE